MVMRAYRPAVLLSSYRAFTTRMAPVAATGCPSEMPLPFGLVRSGGRYAVVTMCIGGGQGIAAVFERM
jgi:acetyl-CoA acetyltransferase